MRLALIALAALAISGCATYSELQKRPPTFTADTSRSPQHFTECVLPQWMNMSPAAHIVPDGETRTIVVPIQGSMSPAVALTLSATPTGGQTHVEMRHMTSTSDFRKQWKEAQSCL